MSRPNERFRVMNAVMTSSSSSSRRDKSDTRLSAKTLQPEDILQGLAEQIQNLNKVVAGLVAAAKLPSGSMVGQHFYARVSGESVEVVIVEDTGEAPRCYRLRRCDTGRLLRRLRSKAALHANPGPWEIPASKRR